MSLTSAKKSLRGLVGSRLKKLDRNSIMLQSESIFTRLLRDSKFQSARAVGLYMTIPLLEVDTIKLIEYCFESDKKVYLPKCVEGSEEFRRFRHMDLIRVMSMELVHNLVPSGKYRLREPQGGENIMDEGGLDVLFVPGVAFTKSGGRLGHGAGYYDEFLQAYASKFGRKPYLVGISLHEQIVDEVPMEPHDEVLDVVLVGSQP